jgi:two-component system, chemotaxis family, chemotaxis protein CheY
VAFTILIVDDSAMARKLCLRCLERVGFDGATFVEAADGCEALAYTRERAFDAIVTDLDMPNLDGRNLCKQLKADGVSCPIVVLSATIEPEGRESLTTDGASAVLKKPAFPPQFAYVLGEALNRFRSSTGAASSVAQ